MKKKKKIHIKNRKGISPKDLSDIYNPPLPQTKKNTVENVTYTRDNDL